MSTVGKNDDVDATATTGLIGAMRRVRAWWREPHFVEKDAIIGIVFLIAQLVMTPPASPAQMTLAICWIALSALLPLRPRTVCVIGPALILAAGILRGDWWWADGSTALLTIFLAVGCVMTGREAAVILGVYTVIDAAGFAWSDMPSVGGSVVEGFVDAINDVNAQDAASSGIVPATGLPHYRLIVFAATLVLDLMILGFLVAIGAAFRRSAEADARATRAERMLGRVTREQELAHMIHDSVANDMSTIAMLAWRAKADDDDTAMLDAIYERSHHALDRVHQVIDVLNGKRGLDSLDSKETTETAGNAGNAAGDGADSPAAAAFDTQLEKYLEDQDRTMAMLGLRGVSRFNGVPDVRVPKPVQRTAMELVEEIYANIVRHCAMPDDATGTAAADAPRHDATEEPAYSLFVDIAPERIRISEVNALADESETLMHGRRHGGGLAMHRAAVERLGGTMRFSRQDGTWMIGAELPLDA
ncbi:sensor histidine kinase [Bifidobacterium platyrrhinorum]|uniref:histidine kinase n=1 Tax=Bifidobacterium platyrrhinorum TaxID=2661628 RepID=A0A6L9SUZ4_9BIFI|nr:hypothetical protein [Bifidobacterium platyrrhinorum]NEG55895.1 hypothetical protein [Bifidobacterium platyrrhinorum]